MSVVIIKLLLRAVVFIKMLPCAELLTEEMRSKGLDEFFKYTDK